LAPQYVAEQLLYAEGFTDVQYVPVPADKLELRLAALASGVCIGLTALAAAAVAGCRSSFNARRSVP
jgi:hypothetical protein